MSSVYSFINNETGQPMIIDLAVGWDNGNFLSITIYDEEESDPIELVTPSGPSSAPDEFFRAIAELHREWQEKNK